MRGSARRSATAEARRYLLISACVVFGGLTPACEVGVRQSAVSRMLHLEAPPPSLRVVACEDGESFTDVVMTCSIEIDPKQFRSLLSGRRYAKRVVSGTSHLVKATLVPPLPNGVNFVGLDTSVGPEFEVTSAYLAEWPPLGETKDSEFPYGGYVRVYADPENRRAIVDYYRE